MEILEGSTLRERLKAEKRLATEKLLCVVRDLCAALGSAHRRHLVHRDLKPENVFLVGTETGEVAKILDFGLAKFVAGSNDRTVDTATGAILGTVRYMSPEQREGQSADQAWDIWALAVTTYEMLTGCYPFDGWQSRSLCRWASTSVYADSDARSRRSRHLAILV
jgi:serine/threonine protein kinase